MLVECVCTHKWYAHPTKYMQGRMNSDNIKCCGSSFQFRFMRFFSNEKIDEILGHSCEIGTVSAALPYCKVKYPCSVE